MKATLIGLVLLLGVAGCGTRQVPLATRQDRFINVIRVLADSGRLTDRHEVERLLGTKLIEKKRYNGFLPSPERCEGQPGNNRTESSVTYGADANFWFKDISDDSRMEKLDPTKGEQGVQHARPPAFSYALSKNLPCSEPPGRPENTDAKIDFERLSSFACITAEQLKSVLPQVKLELATDGAQPYPYWGPRKDTWAIFNFFVGDNCMTGVSLEQSGRVQKVRTESL